MKSTRIQSCLLTLILGLPARGPLSAGTGPDSAWRTPPKTASFLSALPRDLEPTLPAPRLLREPEFTLGESNTLAWPADSIESAAAASGIDLLFYELQASYASGESTVTLWGFVDAGTDSAVFNGLPEGPSIAYRLRYYGRDGEGGYRLSAWSEPQTSIQDAHPPVLTRWDLSGLQSGETARWIIGPALSHRITASDPPTGRVMEVFVHEKSESVDDTVVYDIVPPRTEVDTVLTMNALKTPAHESVTLSLWVRDRAGQSSGQRSVVLFWIPAEEFRMFSFPNPFRPARGEIAVIQVPAPDAGALRIFDPFGSLVRVLRKSGASDLFFQWDGRNDRGDLVSTGGYICVVEGHEKQYCKIAVLR
jgi:hypothetical protein